MGAPSVITNPFQRSYESAPLNDAEAKVLRSVQTLQSVPVYGQAYQFSVPGNEYNRGWLSADVPPVPGPTYVSPPVSAPEIQYVSKSYSRLVTRAAQPPVSNNRQSVQLTAPPIITTFGG